MVGDVRQHSCRHLHPDDECEMSLDACSSNDIAYACRYLAIGIDGTPAGMPANRLQNAKLLYESDCNCVFGIVQKRSQRAIVTAPAIRKALQSCQHSLMAQPVREAVSAAVEYDKQHEPSPSKKAAENRLQSRKEVLVLVDALERLSTPEFKSAAGVAYVAATPSYSDCISSLQKVASFKCSLHPTQLSTTSITTQIWNIFAQPQPHGKAETSI